MTSTITSTTPAASATTIPWPTYGPSTTVIVTITYGDNSLETAAIWPPQPETTNDKNRVAAPKWPTAVPPGFVVCTNNNRWNDVTKTCCEQVGGSSYFWNDYIPFAGFQMNCLLPSATNDTRNLPRQWTDCVVNATGGSMARAGGCTVEQPKSGDRPRVSLAGILALVAAAAVGVLAA